MPSGLECFSSSRGGLVDAAERFSIAELAGAEITLLLEVVEQGIKAAGADAVAVARKLFDHAEAEDGFFGGVVEDVEPDEAGIQVAIGE